MNLVPITNPVPVTEISNVDEERLAAQIQLAEQIRERTRKTISHIMSRVQAMFADLNTYNQDILADVSAMLSEIRLLQEESRKTIEEAGRRNRQPDNLDQEFKQHFEDRGYADLDDEIESVTEPKDENPEVIQLYRKIAGRTHPDKTDDPELHMLFLTAKDYRKKGDLAGLREIWDFITGAATRMTSKLKQKLDELVREVAMLENQLEYLRQNQDYILLNLYEQGRVEVQRMSRVQMTEKRDRIRSHLELLRRTLGKVPPKPAASYLQFEFGKTT